MSEDPALVVTKEDKINQFVRSPILTSQNVGWDGVSLRYMYQPGVTPGKFGK